MRVGFYGNTCNNFYAIARALREHSEVESHLYIDDDADFMQLPESETPELLKAYPKWIHKGNYRPLTAKLNPRLSSLVEEFNKCDLVMVSGGGVRFAPFVNKPVIFFTTGWDLTVAPFPFRFFYRPKGIMNKMAAIVGGYWQRLGIHAVSEIWTQPFFPFAHALRKLGVAQNKIVQKYFPIMIDTELYKTDENIRNSSDPVIQDLLSRFDFFVFHPSRIMINDRPENVETGQWKGNDRLIRGFSEFMKKNPQARPALLMPDRVTSPDLENAKKLVVDLGIEKNVVWMRSPHDFGFKRQELLPYYSLADVVADEFATGWFGSVVVEGLSMGKPMLCTLDQKVMNQLYPWNPVLSPVTEADIANELSRLYSDKEYKKNLGEQGRKWAVEFHSIQNASQHYVRQILDLANSQLGVKGGIHEHIIRARAS